ncbi:Ent-kaur-16-ene synthase chloroplastic [Zea mays]|uniref:Ent-kaur-16-ene synthase chloroplastic n=1 Tax=Zea mays TaxID=4577 RepID=A0A1D6IZQ3_MAIZE|nr:Ent-kaur-16-ene synthase chloroplastic [Zea mays]
MVPSPGSPQAPCFPQCVQWILENQLDNGSWGHNEVDSSADKKETILATLACVIALKKWDVGPAHITKGIQFIARNFQTVTDEQIVVPIGFDFTFSGMFTLAINMGLQFPVRQTDIDGILRLRENELKRYDGDKSTAIEAYCAYVAEGFENLLDWNDVMKFQAKNGSLFNSPSATAAALVANYDDKALQYLNLLVTQFGSAVPTVFPQNIHCQLSMVDTLESVGISRHFSAEIKAVLDMKEEEIMLDAETCAMAFRILQMNGYDVSTDWLSHIAEASNFHNSLQGYLCDTKTLLEMYKASKVILSERDLTLENIGCWTGSLLREKLCSDGAQRVPILEEVEYALKFPHYAIVDPLNNRRSIEHLDARGSQTLKTKYLYDFSFRNDELQNIISWDEHHKVEFCSEKVEIVFYAVYNTVNQLGSMASAVQKRDVTKHLAETWLKVMLCMLTEADWQRRQFVPTVEEYMANAVSSLALAVIILPAQYFLGETLSDYMVKDHEYSNLSELMFTCSRLLNDIRSVEREFEAGKLNSVSLLALHSGGSMSIEAAKKETHGSLESYRRGLVALVRRQDSVVPRSCKELFWKLCKTIHLFYFQIDGFTSPKEMVGAVNQVINEPLELQSSNTHV